MISFKSAVHRLEKAVPALTAFRGEITPMLDFISLMSQEEKTIEIEQLNYSLYLKLRSPW